jgi:hypothetical protein
LKQIAHFSKPIVRNRADYDLASIQILRWPPSQSTCKAAIALLDAIDADPARRAQAIADIRAVFP